MWTTSNVIIYIDTYIHTPVARKFQIVGARGHCMILWVQVLKTSIKLYIYACVVSSESFIVPTNQPGQGQLQ